jgi:hypothetical protein
MNRVMSLLGMSAVLAGCVAGAPPLTPGQEARALRVIVYKESESVPSSYETIGSVSAASCAGAPASGRVWGNAGEAMIGATP